MLLPQDTECTASSHCSEQGPECDPAEAGARLEQSRRRQVTYLLRGQEVGGA